MKLKKVVLELPEQELYVTYDWLREQGDHKACNDAIHWFVNTFGNKAKYEDVLEKAKAERTDWEWLEQNKQYLKSEKDDDYVHIDDVKEQKYYVANIDTFYKIFRTDDQDYGWVRINTNSITSGLSAKTFETLIVLTIKGGYEVYEFNFFDDFIKWYIQNQKIEYSNSEIIQSIIENRNNFFPKLMKHKNCEDDIIVLFSDHSKGIVIFSTDNNYYIGEYREDWIRFNFEDFEGNIILSNKTKGRNEDIKS